MSGILYGVSVGPGDAELMTLKAVRIVNSCDIIAVPLTKNSHTLALDIAKQVCNIEKKEILYFDFLMSNDKKLLEESHKSISQKLTEFLNNGKNIAFLTIGDISIYSTFSYIAELISNAGFEISICPGITSFCAIAADAKKYLVQGNSPLIIMPAACDEFDELIKFNGTKVIMKCGKNISYIKEKITENSYAACSCGLPEEKIYKKLDDLPNKCGYFTTIISEGNSNA